MLNNQKKAALIMLGVIAVQAWPLLAIGVQPGGPAYLFRCFGPTSLASNSLAWGPALAVALSYAALSMVSLPFMRAHMFEATPLKGLAIVFALVTGAFEEWFFRKWIMDALAAHGADLLVQAALSALAFGAVHAVWGLLGGSVRAALKSMLFTTGLGLALALVYLAAGRHLAPAAWSHILINLIIEPWLMLAVMELNREKTAHLQLATI